MKQKQALRGEMRKILASLDPRWMNAATAQTCDNLTRLVEQEYGTPFSHLLAWTAFFPGEVELTRFIESELNRRTIYLPRVVDDGSMTFIPISKGWEHSAESSGFGIPAPRDEPGSTYSSDNGPHTIVIVPGLAFDREGNRIGRGKGFYDRFLARAGMRSAIKIGVCWSLQLVPHVPTDSHDVMMDWIVTEEGAIRTGAVFEEEL